MIIAVGTRAETIDLMRHGIENLRWQKRRAPSAQLRMIIGVAGQFK